MSDWFRQFDYLCWAFFYITGIVLPIIRVMFEPYFKRAVLGWVGRVKEGVCGYRGSRGTNKISLNSRDGVSRDIELDDDDPDIGFLSSSLNNILVCGILKGVHISLKM